MDRKEYYKTYNKMIYQRDKEIIDARNKAYRLANPEQHRAYVKTCKDKDREAVREYNSLYKLAHRAEATAREGKRRALKLNQTPDNANLDVIESIYKMCRRRSQVEGIQYEVDHIKPLSKGGLHHEDNLQIITAHENRVKSAKLIGEY